MKDLIDRQTAIDEVINLWADTLFGSPALVEIKDCIEKLPSAQPEIIRCRECRYHYGSDCDNFAGVWVKDDDFCSRAERREVSE